MVKVYELVLCVDGTVKDCVYYLILFVVEIVV